MARGDIWLYTMPPRTVWYQAIADRAIALRTGGPFVHASVEIGNEWMVDATPQHGVAVHPLIHGAASFGVAAHVHPGQLEQGIAQLMLRVHSDYGWLDIVDDALPDWWPVMLHGAKAYDCSHLVADYLVTCGLGLVLGVKRRATELVSPNDLARALDLMKGRR